MIASETGPPDPCALLRSLVPQATQFDPGGSANSYCEASWRKPDADEIEARVAEEMTAYMQRRATALNSGADFDERMPAAILDANIFLTVAGYEFSDEAAAVSALEAMVGSLREGITVETDETSATFRSDYSERIAGVGAGAAWNPQMSQISAASGTLLFHLSVRVSGDEDEDKALAIELARSIVDAL